MKILAVSDRKSKVIYSKQIRDVYPDVDLVLGCGDLPYYYLEFIVTMLPIPVAYVHGNHDREVHMADGRVIRYPEGCISLEDRTIEIDGLLLAGLGGSMRYNPKARYQYTESQMRNRVNALVPKLVLNKLRYGRYLDILVTHSPPFGIHDGDDLPHTGFKTFLTLMRYFKPRYLLHGHMHLYQKNLVTETVYHETTVVNVYHKRVIVWGGNGSQNEGNNSGPGGVQPRPPEGLSP